MELNRNMDMLLCSLAFQEYNIRQNILGLTLKKNSLNSEKEKRSIQTQIDNLRDKANYLFELRSENMQNIDNYKKI